MNISLQLSLLLLCLVCFGCKSEFETVRTSGNPEAILKKADEYYAAEEYQRAQTLYELSIGPFRGRAEAEEIAYRYAYTYYYTKQFVLASYYFKNFATTYGGSNLREEADFMSAYSNYRLSPVYRLDQSYSLKAIEGFEEFANRYPASERIPEANRLIDEMRAKMELKDFESAKLYMDLERYESAQQSFENVLKDYPETRRAQEIRYLMAKSQYEYAAASFVTRQQERYDKAVELIEYYLGRYPDAEVNNELTTYLKKSQARLKELEDVRYQNPGPRS
ncbi:outer membrane protein assembly factor BamD [Neolewinella lacunae]|uniref:Outer membrane protein assembly factor BamD n=1 Tax=Neolewinella lacunae TaxID=1517758 RepID=A0A923PSM4_9BACT|nr:outer membrane protein assembly factor BamD [Neolewinella lacunae]MBC6996739.1 outer membrane protein assembly factor BamD [Neolewinella lacunae]MDN3633396.1 outer membrane protein assembly factor BamD [Neolewinella lacunae]